MCSSYQAHYYSSITVRSPLWSELGVEFFLYWDEVVLGAQLRVCRCRSPQIGCFFHYCQINSIYQFRLFFTSWRLGWHCVLFFHGALRFLEGVLNRPSGHLIVSVVFFGYPCSGFLPGTISGADSLPFLLRRTSD